MVSTSFIHTRSQPLQMRGDRFLVDVVLSGKGESDRAFSVLAARHQGWLLRACERRLRNRQDAEDAVQETLVRMHRGFSGFKGQSALKTWLSTIMERECATLAARRARRVLEPSLISLIEIFLEQNRHPPSSHDNTGEIRDVIRKLPRHVQELLELRFYSELPLGQIARMQGISLSATKMRLYRALDQVRRIMIDDALAE